MALVIWWCEGTKVRRDKRWKNAYSYAVEVINSNAEIVKIFADFLREDLNADVSKFRGQIQIHEGDNQDEIEDYWSREIKIPKTQFDKTIIRKRGNKPGKNKGTFKLRVYNKPLYLQLQKMLDQELLLINHGA